MKHFRHPMWILEFVVIVSLASGPAHAAQEIGVDRSQLGSQSEAVQVKTLDDIKSLHATWFRDGPTSGSPQGVANFVAEVKRVKQRNLNMLVNIVQMDEDYDGVLPTNRCGWREKALSRINLDKYSQRLRTLFGAIRAAGQTVDAVEFGNEDDQYCYDADVPNGHVASKEELLTWLRGYGHFLKTGALILHDPQYFPNAKIITFGIAHVLAAWDTPSHHLEHPAHVVAMLRDVDSVNYLDNSSYHVDGYGTHLYASNDIEAIFTSFLREDAANLGQDKPFWVTEWGFSNPKAFPNKKGQSVSQAMEECFAVFDKLGKQIPLGPLMFYRYDVWLADGSGGLSPLAHVLSTHAGSR